MAALATAGLVASVSAVLVYRRLHVRTQNGEDVSVLMGEIEASGFNTDGIILLGNSNSQEVIGRLVDYMAEPEPQGTEKSRAAAMEALARIGTHAVPKLLEAIQNAPHMAASIPFANEASPLYIQKEAIKIQARAAMVLGKIGDARALPLLRGLVGEPDPMRLYVKEAIANIEELNGVRHPAINQATADDEVYEVYSAAIRDLFLNWDGSDTNLWIAFIMNRTTTTRWAFDDESPGGDVSSRWTINDNPIDKLTIEDFKRKNQQPILLEPRFTFPARQVLLSDRGRDRVFGESGGSWNAFHRRYRHSVGFISLSRVGFNHERDQALLFVARFCGGTCGEGDYVLLGRDGATWSLKRKYMAFIL